MPKSSPRKAKGVTQSKKTANPVVEALGRVLAETYTLRLRTQGVHWNIQGPLFFSVHTLTEQIYNELAVAADDIAERIRALGAKAPASYAAFARLSKISSDEITGNDQAMVKALIKDNEILVESLQAAIEAADDADDEPSEDMLIARRQAHEKTIWMLKATVG